MSFPTQLTILRILLVPVFYLLLAVAEPVQIEWAALVFCVAAISDWYDGYLARLWKETTPLGAFLDPLADKLLTSAAFVAFAALGLVPWWMVILVILRDVYLTMFRSVADNVRMPVTTSGFAKTKTFIQMVFIAFVLIAMVGKTGHLGEGVVQTSFLVSSPDFLFWLMAVVTAITVASAVQYSYENSRVLSIFGKSLAGIFRRSPQKL